MVEGNGGQIICERDMVVLWMGWMVNVKNGEEGCGRRGGRLG